MKLTPRNGLMIRPLLITESNSGLMSLIGIAKADILGIAGDCRVYSNHFTVDTLTSGPPELPGLIEASVWSRLSRLSAAPPSAPEVVTGRPRPEIMPRVTVVSNLPRALPIAITLSPTLILEELPNLSGF
jgi:hypothetical protein